MNSTAVLWAALRPFPGPGCPRCTTSLEYGTHGVGHCEPPEPPDDNCWVIAFWSLSRQETRHMIVWAEDADDATNQAECRLGSLDSVLSIKHYTEVLAA